MNAKTSNYHGYRFPPEIISHAVWLDYRFCLSLRDVEDLLAKRGVLVSYKTIRQWCRKFGAEYARKLKRREGRLGDTWYLDEVFVTIQGQRQYPWRAVDQDGDVIDILVQPRRNRQAADAKVQVCRSSATILDDPWGHPESLQSRTASAAASQPPDATCPLFPCVA